MPVVASACQNPKVVGPSWGCLGGPNSLTYSRGHGRSVEGLTRGNPARLACAMLETALGEAARGGGHSRSTTHATTALRTRIMAGMPLFAHAVREQLTAPPLPVPLKLIKFSAPKPKKSPFKILRRRPGLFLCVPVLLRKIGKNERKARFCPHLAVLSVVLATSPDKTKFCCG